MMIWEVLGHSTKHFLKHRLGNQKNGSVLSWGPLRLMRTSLEWCDFFTKIGSNIGNIINIYQSILPQVGSDHPWPFADGTEQTSSCLFLEVPDLLLCHSILKVGINSTASECLIFLLTVVDKVFVSKAALVHMVMLGPHSLEAGISFQSFLSQNSLFTC